MTRVYTTEKGKQLNHLLTFFETMNDQLMHNFSDQEKETLFKLLERVIENADQALKDL